MISMAVLSLAATQQAHGQTPEPGERSIADSAAIVVTGRRAALESAENRKRMPRPLWIRSWLTMRQVAGQFDHRSAAARPGVTIVRFAAINDPDHYSVEGSGIQIRGLSGVASRLNGREIFSANGGRSLLWGDVTPS
jgi:hypothetical protein